MRFFVKDFKSVFKTKLTHPLIFQQKAELPIILNVHWNHNIRIRLKKTTKIIQRIPRLQK
jgi:hypothetical protein